MRTFIAIEDGSFGCVVVTRELQPAMQADGRS